MDSKTPLALLVASALLLAGAKPAKDTGPVQLTFTQPADCARIDHWVVVGAPLHAGTASPTLATAYTIATIENRPPLVCGTRTTVDVRLPRHKALRLWLIPHTAAPDHTPGPPSAPLDLDTTLTAPSFEALSPPE